MPRFPAFRPGLAPLLLAGLLSAAARPAYAVPHIEFGGEGLLILLLLALLLLFGVPVGVGLLVRWLLRPDSGPRTGFYRPLAFATVGWVGVCFLVRILTADLDPGAAGALLPAGLGLLTAIGAAAAGVRADQADAAETPNR